jgi:hypothetical protein
LVAELATTAAGQPAQAMAEPRQPALVLASQQSAALGVVGSKQLVERSRQNQQEQVHRRLPVLPAVV